MGFTVYDVALMLEVMMGRDDGDEKSESRRGARFSSLPMIVEPRSISCR